MPHNKRSLPKSSKQKAPTDTTKKTAKKPLRRSSPLTSGYIFAFVAILLGIGAWRVSYHNNSTQPPDIPEEPEWRPDIREPNTTAWKVVSMPHRGGGKGVIATRRIELGEMLMAEKPWLRVPTSGTLTEISEALAEETRKLTDEQIRILESLSDAWSGSDRWKALGKWGGKFQVHTCLLIMALL